MSALVAFLTASTFVCLNFGQLGIAVIAIPIALQKQFALACDASPLSRMRNFFHVTLKIVSSELLLTFARKVTNYLSTSISLKMAKRSEAKSAKRNFSSKIKI